MLNMMNIDELHSQSDHAATSRLNLRILSLCLVVINATSTGMVISVDSVNSIN